MSSFSLFLLLVCLLHCATAQTVFNCPATWYPYAQYCFLFQGDQPATYEEARLACSNHGAALLSVEDRATHTFIRNWLDANDPFVRSWYTSGLKEKVATLRTSVFVWKGTGSKVSPDLNLWGDGLDRNNSNGVIVYSLGPSGYAWSLVPPDEKLPFICQVPTAEAYRIVQDVRDYDYGRVVLDFNVLKRGPHFTHQPVSTVVVGKPLMAEIECVADSNPPPSYRWFRGKQFDTEVTSESDPRYTVTNGKLTIQDPVESRDAGDFQCTARNELGQVISNEVQLTFGALGEFSNVHDAAVNAKAYDGVAIECSNINFKPAVKYNWFRDDTTSFVRPSFQTYQFISQNGKLYFSEVTRADAGRYRCLAVLTGVNRFTIGTSQPPTRTSLPIALVIHDQAPKADWGPEIQDDFIAVFPQPPLKGQDVRLECFAYGSSNTPFYYRWTREGKPIPGRAQLSDHNRVLTIPDAALEDQGTYTCVVSRSTNAADSKSYFLSLGARPYFISPLRDQHVDINSQLTWRCDARANPPSSYIWYKNGRAIGSDTSQGITVKGNVMRIDRLDPKLHDGMYQCGATNIYGMTLSEAQLRVLAFPPSFAKHPLRSQVKAAIMGNATITCSPEGAPSPLITWLRNGAQISGDGNHVIILPNGNLVLQGVQTSDRGQYTCKAENEFGVDISSTTLTIAASTSITLGPVNTRAQVNNTAFLTCVASFDPTMDLVYTWYFNGRLIDTDHLPDFSQTRRGRAGMAGLYVRNVGLEHGGRYTCVAQTPLNQDSRAAYLTVIGPPGEPVGCLAEDVWSGNNSVAVMWTPGADNHRPVSRFTVEVANSFNPNTWTTAYSAMPGDIDNHPETLKKIATIKDLSPGNGYRFRVKAYNVIGVSRPSVPSSWVYMSSAPPTVAPRGVGGGGGSVGDLTLKWTPLERYEEAGSKIGYKVYWRRYGEKSALWDGMELMGYNDHYVHFVGGASYFLEYEVKVQAFNSAGYGPNSTSNVIFSAEDLPIAAVTDVRGEGYNGTANLVTWTQLPSTREMARGIVLGYQINYWLWSDNVLTWKEFIRVHGQVGEGIYLGVESDTNYICEVRAFNGAGMGPPSESYLIETLHLPVQTYPEEVRVYSAGHGQVLIWWRGVHILQPEENVHGWVLYFWPANEHYRSACEMLIHDHHANDAHVTVDPGVIYALRVGAWSTGGYGKKTPTVYFTLEGQVTIDASFAKEIDVFMATATSTSTSLLLLLLCLLVGTTSA